MIDTTERTGRSTRIYDSQVETFQLDVHVRPGARHSRVDGLHDGVLAVRVSAPPVEGAANAAVCRVVAKAFGLRPRQVEVIRGATSRRKRLRLDLPVADGTARLTALTTD